MQVVIRLPARRIAFILGSIALYLCVQSLVGKAVEYELGTHSTYFIYQFVRLVNVNRESSLPTWYASTLLLIAAVLLAVIAYAQRFRHAPYARHWGGLAAVFLYLSVDEGAEIHEKLTAPLQDEFNTTGYLFFAWAIAGAVFVVVVGLLYLRFVMRLPNRTRALFLLAAALYVGGALGLDAVGANKWYEEGGTSLTFSAIGTVEEFCEMLGLVVFIYALLSYAASFLTAIQIVIMPQPDQTLAAPPENDGAPMP